jgi:hypothetical protein
MNGIEIIRFFKKNNYIKFREKRMLGSFSVCINGFVVIKGINALYKEGKVYIDVPGGNGYCPNLEKQIFFSYFSFKDREINKVFRESLYSHLVEYLKENNHIKENNGQWTRVKTPGKP